MNPFFSGSTAGAVDAAGVGNTVSATDLIGDFTAATGDGIGVVVESADSSDCLLLASKLLRRFSAVVLLHAGEKVNFILPELSSGSNSSMSRPAIGFGESKVNSLSTILGLGVGFAWKLDFLETGVVSANETTLGSGF